MKLLSLFLLFFILHLASNSKAADPMASPTPDASAPIYLAWTPFPSARFPLIIYCPKDADAKKQMMHEEVAKEALFRVEAAWAEFQEEHPGFTIKIDRPIQAPMTGDADKQFGALAKRDPYLLPINTTQTINQPWGNVYDVLENALRLTTRHALPDWFYAFLLADHNAFLLDTGVDPLPLINPLSLVRLSNDGKIRDLAALAKLDPQAVTQHSKAAVDDGFMSALMYARYAQEAAGGKDMRDAITHVLVSAQRDGTAQALNDLFSQSKWNADVQAWWRSLRPDAYVLDRHMEASARLWAALAAFAGRAGTRYSSFDDLATAVASDKIALPANVPRSLVKKAHMFRDHDSGYQLSWDGENAVLREITPEKVCFEIHTSFDKAGGLREEMQRKGAIPADLILLPKPETNSAHCEHFAIFTDGSPNHVASIVLQADRYEEYCVAALPWSPRPNPARIVMYYYENAWESGLFYTNYYIPDLGVTFVSSTGDATMRHEITHQIVDFSAKGKFPLWFNEAIAEYYGHHLIYAGDGFVPYRDKDEVQDLHHYLGGQWPGEWGRITIPQLVHMDFHAWRGLKHGPYTLAWSLAYFLNFGDEGAHKALFDDYMKMVASDKGDPEARDAQFGDAVLALEPAWRKYWSAMPESQQDIPTAEAHARLLVLLTRQAEAQNLAIKDPGSILTFVQHDQIHTSPDDAERIAPTALDDMKRWYNWWADQWTLKQGPHGPEWTCSRKDGAIIKAGFEVRDGVTQTVSSVINPPTAPFAAGAHDGNHPSMPPMPSVHDGDHPPSTPSVAMPSVHDGDHPPMPPMPSVHDGNHPRHTPSPAEPSISPGQATPTPTP